jgi:HSP20 family molecular chaperone IbpA
LKGMILGYSSNFKNYISVINLLDRINLRSLTCTYRSGVLNISIKLTDS